MDSQGARVSQRQNRGDNECGAREPEYTDADPSTVAPCETPDSVPRVCNVMLAVNGYLYRDSASWLS
jgi:hypothetical protein